MNRATTAAALVAALAFSSCRSVVQRAEEVLEREGPGVVVQLVDHYLPELGAAIREEADADRNGVFTWAELRAWCLARLAR